MDIETAIRETIENEEPRANIENIDVGPSNDENGYNVTLEFSVLNESIIHTVEFFLERVR